MKPANSLKMTKHQSKDLRRQVTVFNSRDLATSIKNFQEHYDMYIIKKKKH